MIPYGRQWIDDEDIQAVVECLKSPWLTTGPQVSLFEEEFSAYVHASTSVAVNSGTAALHAAYYAAGVASGDEVIVPAITFAATANAALYLGAKPIFADVEADTLLIDATKIESLITAKTKAIVAVDYAGQPCDYDALRLIARKHNLKLISDGCHALGAKYNQQHVGGIADFTAFSFHPVKHLTTGEGGMITTNDANAAKKMKTFRNHGITTDHRERESKQTWQYEMTALGYNYRISDFQCALGRTQLKKQDRWLLRRKELANAYNDFFKQHTFFKPLNVRPGNEHAYHLYVVKVADGLNRDEIFLELRKRNIAVNVHYSPVYLHPYYLNSQGTRKGLCPVAESVSNSILSLPMYPTLNNEDFATVLSTISAVTKK